LVVLGVDSDDVRGGGVGDVEGGAGGVECVAVEVAEVEVAGVGARGADEEIEVDDVVADGLDPAVGVCGWGLSVDGFHYCEMIMIWGLRRGKRGFLTCVRTACL